VLKVVSDSISKYLFCKNFLGVGGGAMPPDSPRRLVLHTAPMCFAHQYATPLPYDHAISEKANQIWF